jgi:hypothetical protein
VEPNLVKVTEIFLVPSSFLVAALGTADTNPHRAAVSLVGLIVSIFWIVCCKESLPKHDPSLAMRRSARSVILALLLPLLFIIGWGASVAVHLLLWNQSV